MRHIKKITVFILFLFLSIWKGEVPAESSVNQISQLSFPLFDNVEAIPGDEGLAGVFAGVHNNVLLVAGGTAFPEGKPWEGGTKYFSDAVLVYEHTSNGVQLLNAATKLPVALGEGASVSLPQGVLCIGGQSPDGLSNQVFLLGWNGTSVDILEFPALPVPVKSPAAAAIGNTVYVVGGESENGATNQFIALNITNPENDWQKFPDFPLPVSGAAAVAQMDGEEVSLYVFGGRAKNEGEITTTFYPHVFRFRPSEGKWVQKKDMEFPLAVAVAAPIGASHIVLAGGDSGETFTKVEQAIHAMQTGDENARQLRDSLWINYPGFNSKLKIYNTVTDVWFDAGNWEGTPVAVAPAVIWNGSAVVPGGEIRPATRTPFLHEIQFLVKPVFGWLNYLVLGIYFLGMLLLGFYFMRRENSTDDFFKAGGRIPWWAAGISIFATTLSAITFIAIPAKSYAADWRMFMFNMAIIMVAPIVIR